MSDISIKHGGPICYSEHKYGNLELSYLFITNYLSFLSIILHNKSKIFKEKRQLTFHARPDILYYICRRHKVAVIYIKFNFGPEISIKRKETKK